MASANLGELLPAAHLLSRADKVQLIQQLVGDLATDEVLPGLQNGTVYPVWAPIEAPEGGAILLEMLKAEGTMG
jgi:hypothetical protein